MGQHQECVEPQDVIAVLEYAALSEPISVIDIGIVKVSVCLCLLRIVDGAKRKTRLFLWSLLILVVLSHLGLAMVFFLHCLPLAALWNPVVHGNCMSTDQTVLAGYVGFAFDIVTDLVCALIPIIVISRLQMNIRTKIALCILMGLGVFTAGAAVAKAFTLRGVFDDDGTWGFTEPATWAAVEQFVGIIIISTPALKPFFSRFLRTRRSGLGYQYGKRWIAKHASPKWSVSHKWTSGWIRRFSKKQQSVDTESSDRTLIDERDQQESVSSEYSLRLKKDLEAGGYPNHLKTWTLPDDNNRLSAVLRIPDRIYRFG